MEFVRGVSQGQNVQLLNKNSCVSYLGFVYSLVKKTAERPLHVLSPSFLPGGKRGEEI